MKNFKVTALFFFFSLFAQTSLGDTYQEEIHKKMPYLDNYAILLNKYVKPQVKNDIEGTGIDYLAWQSDPLHKETLALLQNTDTSKLTSTEERISFWINAYNFFTIDLIVTQGEQETIHNLGGLVGDPWNEFTWVVNGLEFTLSQIHNQMLDTAKEPRIHFALSCAAVSCPDLRNKPYYPQRIYSQLDEQAEMFLHNEKKGVEITRPKQTNSRITHNQSFKVSRLFELHLNDFADGQIEHFINRYVNVHGMDFNGYIPHDWSLNALEGKEPKQVKEVTLSFNPAMPALNKTQNPYY